MKLKLGRESAGAREHALGELMSVAQMPSAGDSKPQLPDVPELGWLGSMRSCSRLHSEPQMQVVPWALGHYHLCTVFYKKSFIKAAFQLLAFMN